MEKCDVCGKKTLLPEVFDGFNVCKVCFVKINGPFWKHSYKRYSDAEKNHQKALSNASKQNFPPDIISAIDMFFLNQMNGMVKCTCCKQLVNKLIDIENTSICEDCFSKINNSAWKEKEYLDNEQVETNRKQVLLIAQKNNFPMEIVNNINQYFDKKIQPGLICVVDGGVGQILKVYEDYCELITSNRFDLEEMSKRYGKALRHSKFSANSFTKNAAKAMAFGVLIPGGTIVQAGVRAAASAAVTIAADMFLSGKSKLNIVKGNIVINYTRFEFADYLPCGNGENDVGYIRFTHGQENLNNDIVFLFARNEKKAERAYEYIYSAVNSAQEAKMNNKEANVINNQTLVQNAQIVNNHSAADEIKKFKELLDMGIITQEEFNAKKKELLGL